MDENASLEALCRVTADFTLPRWRELPDLELYMDQVLSLMERYLGAYPGYDGKQITAPMVNNYVKQGAMPAPVRKKYTREHLAQLIMICLMKASLPIAAIRELIAAELADAPTEIVYDSFCSLFERAASDASAAAIEQRGQTLGPVWYAALRAQAEQALALRLSAAEPS